MSNGFVEYLCSMNNANSNNENALAESQVTNPYYEKIKVKRQIGDNIYNRLFSRDENICVILTGHAGDGKTSILIQILDKLGYFKLGKKPLQEKELLDNKLFYVKDMSELNSDKQEKALMLALKYPSDGISSFLISNTGPLLNTFKRLIEKSLKNNGVVDEKRIKSEQINLEKKILKGIEKVESELLDIDLNGRNYKFLIYNIANIDNTYFINEIIDKICNEELWAECKKCPSKMKCPIYFNYCTLTSHKEYVSKFLSYLYFWLNEKERRLTIRQMLSHLTYGVTGSLNCDSVSNSKDEVYKFIFENAFPNLIFGYKGIRKDKQAQNIRAIQELNNLGIDKKTITGDYVLLVRNNFEIFDKLEKEVIEQIFDKEVENLGLFKQDDNHFKRAFRRFYLIYARLSEEEFNELLSEIYSPVYKPYYKLISEGKISHLERKNIINIVFNGLYKTYIGVNPLQNDTKLYLTVRKSFNDIQNVQLIQAEIDLDKISLRVCKNEELLESSYKRYIPVISFAGEEIELKLGMLDYLYKIQNGKLITSLEPNYSFDLTNWRSMLSRKFKHESDNQIRLLIIKNTKNEKIILTLEDEKIIAERR